MGTKLVAWVAQVDDAEACHDGESRDDAVAAALDAYAEELIAWVDAEPMDRTVEVYRSVTVCVGPDSGDNYDDCECSCDHDECTWGMVRWDDYERQRWRLTWVGEPDDEEPRWERVR